MNDFTCDRANCVREPLLNFRYRIGCGSVLREKTLLAGKYHYGVMIFGLARIILAIFNAVLIVSYLFTTVSVSFKRLSFCTMLHLVEVPV